MRVQYAIRFINPEFFPSVISSQDDSLKCTALDCRILFFKVCPRIGESVAYPLFDLLDIGTREWLHNHVALEVVDVIHNPTGIETLDSDIDNIKSERDPDVLLKVLAKNNHPYAKQ